MVAAEHSEVHVAIFGGMKFVRPSIDLSARPPRERLILARLVVAQGTPVSTSELVDTLWEFDPPSTAVNQIHRHIGELRRLLEPHLPARASGTYVLSAGDAYRINAAVFSSDLADVLRLWSAAGAASPSSAIDLYADALAIAAEPPFPDLPWSVRERPEFAAIQRKRMALAVDAADCALVAGSTTDIVSAVEIIASGAPLDERMQSRLIRLLANVGRRADAVQVFETTKGALLRELGMLPGAELQAAVRAVLADESDPVEDIPTRLPALPASTVEQGQFDSVIAEATASALAGSSALVAISGMPGIGKTTLAVAWGHAASRSFPGGQLFLDLHGFDRSGRRLSTSDALGRLLEDLEVNLAGVRAGDDVRRELYLKTMRNKRMVVILDNASDADQVRTLLPDSPGSLVIVTSRNQLSGLVVRNGALSVPLSRWSATASRDLLVKRLGSARVAAADEAVDSIIASCGGLPLALALAAAASAVSADSAVQDVATRLAATATALDVLSLDDSDDLRSTFDWSLQVVSPAAATVFEYASMHPGSHFAPGALAALADLALDHTTRAVSELTSANVLIRTGADRYAMHDLLRIYSMERAVGLDAEGAKERLIRYYVHSTRQAFLTYGRPPVVDLLGTEPSAAVERFESPAQAVAWFVAERQALLEVFHWAIAKGMDRQAALLALDWRPMIQTVNGAHTIAPFSQLAVSAAARVGEPRLEAELRRDLGSKLGECGEQQQCLDELEAALAIYQGLGDLIGQSNTLRNLAQFSHAETSNVEHSRQALDTARRSGDLPTIANALLTDINVNFIPRKAWQELFDAATEVLQIIDVAGPEYLRPYTRGYRAYALVGMGSYAQALHEAEAMDDDVDPTLMIMHAAVTARAWVHLGDRRRALQACDRHDTIWSTYSDYFRDRPLRDDMGIEGIRELLEGPKA